MSEIINEEEIITTPIDEENEEENTKPDIVDEEESNTTIDDNASNDEEVNEDITTEEDQEESQEEENPEENITDSQEAPEPMTPPAPPVTNTHTEPHYSQYQAPTVEEKQNIEIILKNIYKYTYDTTEECIYKESIAEDSKHNKVKISNIPEQASRQINSLTMQKRRELIEQIIINTEKQLEEIYRNTSISRPEL